MKILVTGSAGFIGYHTTKKILEKGNIVVGVDNLNDYYDVNLKLSRLHQSGISKQEIDWNKEIKSSVFDNYTFVKINIQDKDSLKNLFNKHKFEIVIHLAAQAGVRYSIENPDIYIQSNILGFFNLLECCRHSNIKHFIYASSSSVYGNNKKVPFSVVDKVENPISLYAATKKSNELMAYTYSHLYKIPTTGLRFFTVYGPWGRPDMAIFLFVKAIIDGKPIKVFNNGKMRRDFTFIDDIVKGIEIVLENPPKNNQPPYHICNLGNGKPESLLDFIKAIEKSVSKKAIKKYFPMQAGDVTETWSNNDYLNHFGYKSTTSIYEGVSKFVKWYKTYYNLN